MLTGREADSPDDDGGDMELESGECERSSETRRSGPATRSLKAGSVEVVAFDNLCSWWCSCVCIRSCFLRSCGRLNVLPHTEHGCGLSGVWTAKSISFGSKAELSGRLGSKRPSGHYALGESITLWNTDSPRK